MKFCFCHFDNIESYQQPPFLTSRDAHCYARVVIKKIGKNFPLSFGWFASFRCVICEITFTDISSHSSFCCGGFIWQCQLFFCSLTLFMWRGCRSWENSELASFPQNERTFMEPIGTIIWVIQLTQINSGVSFSRVSSFSPTASHLK